MHKALLSVLLASASLPAMADWASGGGQLLKDANNPWFIQNTREVKYCVKIEEQSFGVGLEAVQRKVREAIDYWKTQFSFANTPSFDGSPFGHRVRVATQDFIQTTCDDDPDLSFQFGILSHEQRDYLKDPSSYIAIAVRTSYDLVNLKGKGFVYVAPPAGPLRFKAEGLVDQPWSMGDGGLLHKVLVHELGHVFGIPHRAIDNRIDPQFSIMNEQYPQSILYKDDAEAHASTRAIPSFFRSLDGDMSEYCMPAALPKMVTGFFGIAETFRCVKLGMYENTVYVFARETEDQQWNLAGTMKSDVGPVDGYPLRERVVSVHITREQQVFSDLPDYLYSRAYLPGPEINAVRVKGTYIGHGVNRPMFVTANPSHFEVGGMVGTDLILNVFWGQ